MATFLTSSLNVELVHVILISIGRSSGVARSSFKHYLEKDFKVKREHQIDSIKVKDPEKWQVAKLPDFLIKEYDLKSHKDTVKSEAHNPTIVSSTSSNF